MAQIVEFPASSGLASGGAAKLFVQGSDTVVATAGSLTEGTNALGRYQASFTGVTVATYDLIAFDSTGAPFYVGVVSISATSGQFATGDLTLPSGGGGGDCPTTTEIVDAITAAGLPITVTSPVSETGLVTITQGDNYATADGRELQFPLSSATWGNLTGASVSFVASRSGETIGPVSGTIANANTVNQVAQIQLVPADTASVTPTDGPGEYYRYSVRVTDAGGHEITTFKGNLRLDRNLFA